MSNVSIPASAITQTVSEWVNRLSIQWDRIGVDQAERQHSIDMLVNDFKKVLVDRYDAQVNKREILEKQIVGIKSTILSIEKQLNINNLLNENNDTTVNLTIQLQQLDVQLQNAIAKRNVQLQQFMPPLNELKQCMIQLHKHWFNDDSILISNHDTTYGIYECVLQDKPDNVDLTDVSLQLIQQCVSDSRCEINARRENRYSELNEINMLLKLLEFDTVDAVGIDAIALNNSCWDDSAVTDISDESVCAYTHRLAELRTTKTEQDSRIEQLVVQIDSLWKRLNISHADRDAFKVRHTTVGAKTIDALLVEISRLEALKLQNIQQFIENIRNELQLVWDATHTLQSVRDQFISQYHNQYDDTVLCAYEGELGRCNDKLHSMQSVLELVNKRIQYKNDAVILNDRLRDPERFKGKGVSAKMAEENKLRNNIEKLAPKNDMELKQAVIEWETQWNDTFYVNNQSLLQTLISEEMANKKLQGSKRGSKNANSTDVNNQFLVPNTPSRPMSASTVNNTSAQSTGCTRPGTGNKLLSSTSKRNLMFNKENSNTLPMRQTSNLSHASTGTTPTKVKQSGTLTGPIAADKLNTTAAQPQAQPIVKRSILASMNS